MVGLVEHSSSPVGKKTTSACLKTKSVAHFFLGSKLLNIPTKDREPPRKKISDQTLRNVEKSLYSR